MAGLEGTARSPVADKAFPSALVGSFVGKLELAVAELEDTARSLVAGKAFPLASVGSFAGRQDKFEVEGNLPVADNSFEDTMELQGLLE